MWHTQIPLEQFKAVVDALGRVISPIGSNVCAEVVLCVYYNIIILIYYLRTNFKYIYNTSTHVVIRTRDNRSNLPRDRLTDRPTVSRFLCYAYNIYVLCFPAYTFCDLPSR